MPVSLRWSPGWGNVQSLAAMMDPGRFGLVCRVVAEAPTAAPLVSAFSALSPSSEENTVKAVLLILTIKFINKVQTLKPKIYIDTKRLCKEHNSGMCFKTHHGTSISGYVFDLLQTSCSLSIETNVFFPIPDFLSGFGFWSYILVYPIKCFLKLYEEGGNDVIRIVTQVLGFQVGSQGLSSLKLRSGSSSAWLDPVPHNPGYAPLHINVHVLRWSSTVCFFI